MLEFTLAALLVSSTALLVHYHQHFRGQCCQKKRQRSKATGLRIRTDWLTHSFGCKTIYHIKSASKEKIDFFPLSCMYYVAFILLLTIITMSMEILNAFEYISYDTAHLIYFTNDVLGRYYIDNSLYSLNEPTFIHALDYIIIYGVMILSIWESLHSFYRYYTTFSSVFKLTFAEPKHVLKLFSVYSSLYTIVYIITVHWFYWTFPLVVFAHCAFNMYCNYQFTNLLFQKYKAFANEKTLRCNKAQKILHSVRHMQITSSICCILQTLYLTIFLVTYNVTTILLLPLLWSICSILFCSEFIRNRNYVNSCFTRKKKNESINAEQNIKTKLTKASINVVIELSAAEKTVKDVNNSSDLSPITPHVTPMPQTVPVSIIDYHRFDININYNHSKDAGNNETPRLQFYPTAPTPSSHSSKFKPNAQLVPSKSEKSNEMDDALVAKRMGEAMFSLDTWTKHGFCDRLNFDTIEIINKL